MEVCIHIASIVHSDSSLSYTHTHTHTHTRMWVHAPELKINKSLMVKSRLVV